MQERLQFFIDGRFVDPVEGRPFEVVNPATEEPIARIALGSAKDVDLAVTAARLPGLRRDLTRGADRAARGHRDGVPAAL